MERERNNVRPSRGLISAPCGPGDSFLKLKSPRKTSISRAPAATRTSLVDGFRRWVADPIWSACRIVSTHHEPTQVATPDGRDFAEAAGLKGALRPCVKSAKL